MKTTAIEVVKGIERLANIILGLAATVVVLFVLVVWLALT